MGGSYNRNLRCGGRQPSQAVIGGVGFGALIFCPRTAIQTEGNLITVASRGALDMNLSSRQE